MNIKFSKQIRKPLAVMLLVCTASVWHYYVSDPVYEAKARLNVPEGWLAGQADVDDDLLQSGGEAFYETIRPKVLAVAAKNIEKRQTHEESDDAEPPDSQQLDDQLTVTRLDEEPTLEITYHTADGNDAISVLTAILDAYLEVSQELSTEQAALLTEQLNQQADRLRSEQDEQSKAIVELEGQLAASSLDESEEVAVLERIKQFSKQLVDAKSARLKAENQYQQANQELQSGAGINLVVAQLTPGSTKEIAEAVLTHADLVEELAHLREAQHEFSRFFGPKHPHMVKIADRIRNLIKRVQASKEMIDATGEDAVALAEGPDRNSMLLKSLQLDLQRRQGFEKDLQEQLELEQAKLEQQTKLQAQIQQAKTSLATAATQLADMQQKLQSTQTQSQSLASVSESPTLAPEPISPNPITHLIIGGLTAIVLALLTWRMTSRSAAAARSAGELSESEPAALHIETLQEQRLQRLAQLKQNRPAA